MFEEWAWDTATLQNFAVDASGKVLSLHMRDCLWSHEHGHGQGKLSRRSWLLTCGELRSTAKACGRCSRCVLLWAVVTCCLCVALPTSCVNRGAFALVAVVATAPRGVQAFYATLSLKLYTASDPLHLDTTAMLVSLQQQLSPYPYENGTHFQVLYFPPTLRSTTRMLTPVVFAAVLLRPSRGLQQRLLHVLVEFGHRQGHVFAVQVTGTVLNHGGLGIHAKGAGTGWPAECRGPGGRLLRSAIWYGVVRRVVNFRPQRRHMTAWDRME